jgi:hypothetical protein
MTAQEVDALILFQTRDELAQLASALSFPSSTSA